MSQKTCFKDFLGKPGWYSPKLSGNSKISCISTSFEKEVSILSHIAKKLKARQYLQNCLYQPRIKNVIDVGLNLGEEFTLFCP